VGKKAIMVSVEEETWEETKRQLADINSYRKKGNKLTMSAVVEKMLQMWNRVK
jgi:hypothetical protein